MELAKLTIGQKNALLHQKFTVDSYFNPVQDINGDWFISIEEITQSEDIPFGWVRKLELSEYIAPPSDFLGE